MLPEEKLLSILRSYGGILTYPELASLMNINISDVDAIIWGLQKDNYQLSLRLNGNVTVIQIDKSLLH